MNTIELRDLKLLFDWLDLNGVLKRDRYASHTPDDIEAVLELVRRIAEQEVAPCARASDLQEPQLTPEGDVTVLPAAADAVRVIADSGLFGAPFDFDAGGLQLPLTVYTAALATLMSANISVPSFMLLTVANARLIKAFASPAQVEAFALPQIEGKTLGTMCLSEPQAGSALSDIRTRAVEEGEDELGRRFRIKGSKMWISAGDHNVTDNIIHLVLAKVADEEGRTVPGTKGISLFIVPKILPDGARNDVAVSGLNHKLGYRGIPNCALNFGDGSATPGGAPGAIGWLVGEPGQGLPQMFHMMNEARVSVGVGAAALACRGYSLSLDYARQRPQGRPIGVRDGDPVPIIQHADVRAMLLTQKAYAYGGLALALYSARLQDEELTAPNAADREAAASLLALLTPVTKTFPSEMTQQSLHHAIQIHGGAGYTRDFEVEQLYRDNRLNPIHEGTTGIHGMDLVGRKLRKDGGKALALLKARVATTIAEARAIPAQQTSAAQLEKAWTQVTEAAASLMAEPDETAAQAQATSFLFGFGHAVVGWLWLDLAVACERKGAADDSADKSLLRGHVLAARHFLETELPRIPAWLAPLAGGTPAFVDIREDEF